jgi:enediyne biosynthesis protein E4
MVGKCGLFRALPLLIAAAWPGLEPPAPDPSAPSVRFRDVADRSSFSYVSNNDYRGRKYFPQPMCGGIALIDYDRDGTIDIFFTNGAKLPEYTRPDPSYYNCLLRGRGDGTFEETTAKAEIQGQNLDFSFGVAAGDLDNDGDPDLFIANAGPNTLYRNNGDGTFTDISAGSGLDSKARDLLSVCAAFFDYDRDGLLDLVVSHYTFWSPVMDKRCLTPDGEVYCAPQMYSSVPHSLYRNLGGGRFEDVTEKSGFVKAKGKGMGIAIADFDENGWTDVFVANDTEPNFLYLNQGDGTFTEASWGWSVAYDEQGTVVSGMGADSRDFNNDGWPDVFYNNLQSQIWALFQNEGGRQFRYVSLPTGVSRLSRRFSGWSNHFVDYDNDGWKDIYSANGDVDYVGPNSAQHDTIFQNLDGKSFADVSSGLGPDFNRMGYQRGSAVGDLNGDGFPDLVVTSLNKRPRILLNSGDNGRHWLWFDLVGRKGNRDAIGAKLKVTTATGRVLYNHVSVSSGFMSSSDKRVHFGLGDASAVRSVEIRWPSGSTQTLEHVAVDRVLRIEEPTGAVACGDRPVSDTLTR